jgi:hypothetical protein
MQYRYERNSILLAQLRLTNYDYKWADFVLHLYTGCIVFYICICKSLSNGFKTWNKLTRSCINSKADVLPGATGKQVYRSKIKSNQDKKVGNLKNLRRWKMVSVFVKKNSESFP